MQDAKFLFKYYISLKMYREAAKTAVVIASEEQANGSYRIAHELLFGMYQELVNEGIKVSFEVQNNLMLLHSYLIIKVKFFQIKCSLNQKVESLVS